MDSGLHGDPDSEQFRSTFISEAFVGIFEAYDASWMAVSTAECNGGVGRERATLKCRTVMFLYASPASVWYKERILFPGAVGGTRNYGFRGS